MLAQLTTCSLTTRRWAATETWFPWPQSKPGTRGPPQRSRVLGNVCRFILLLPFDTVPAVPSFAADRQLPAGSNRTVSGNQNPSEAIYRMCLTRASIRSTAFTGSSCAQTRTTVHPAALSAWSTFRSRAMFPSSFFRQNSALFFGHDPCSGQPCQKHPST